MILNFAPSLKPAIQSSSCLFNDGIFNILFNFIQFKYLQSVSMFSVLDIYMFHISPKAQSSGLVSG